MYCIKCGKEIANGSKFCPICGASQQVPQNGQSVSGFSETQDVNKKKNFKIGLIFSLIVVIAVLAAASLVIILHKPTVNLNDYIKVSYEGRNTEGEANVYFDSKKLYGDYGKKLEKNFTKNYSESLLEHLEDVRMDSLLGVDDIAYDFFHYYVDGILDESKDLSNGDVITYTFDISEYRQKQIEDLFGIKLKFKDQKFTVKGLEE